MRRIIVICLQCLILLSACSSDTTLPPENNVKRYSLKFDGKNDWIDIGDSNSLEIGLKSYTFELWFKTGKKNFQSQLFRKGYNRRVINEGRWVLSLDTTNVIRIISEDINNTIFNKYRGYGKTTVTDNQWHHLAVVFDRNTAMIVYIDGNLEIYDTEFNNISYSIHNNDEVNVYIGRSHEGWGYFDGHIHDIRVWDYARSHKEIKDNMFTVYSGREDNLICYYKMSEGEGQRLYDHAAKNHGQFGSTPLEDENDPGWSEQVPIKIY